MTVNQKSEDHTDYACKDCGAKTVIKDVSENWLRFICTTCDSHTPLTINELVVESKKQ